MTTTIALWLILLCSGILTYATRLSFILLFGKVAASAPPMGRLNPIASMSLNVAV